jgi:hypothetical protein
MSVIGTAAAAGLDGSVEVNIKDGHGRRRRLSVADLEFLQQ